MCNLYSVTKGQAAIVAFTRAMRDSTGNLPPLPGIFPDYMAPVVRIAPDGVRELAMLRWGMPSSQFALMQAAKKRAARLEAKGQPSTSSSYCGWSRTAARRIIRNVTSKHWQRWLGVEHRCVVPFTSFSEFNKAMGGDVWFALDEGRPLAVFAGIWTTWTCVRKVKEGEVTRRLLRFPHHRSERRGRQGPPEGHAGDPAHGRRDRDVADGAGRGSVEAAAAVTGRVTEDRGHGEEAGRGRVVTAGQPF